MDIDLGPGDGRNYRDYVNVPRTIARVVSSRLASLVELDTVLGGEDLYDLLDIVLIDAHNERVAARED